MNESYAFGAGYNLDLERNWIGSTDGLYHTGFLNFDFRLYDNLKFSIIPQISYFHINYPGLETRMIPAFHIRWTYVEPIANTHLGVFGKVDFGISYNEFYLLRERGSELIPRGQVGGGLFYYNNAIKLSAGLLGSVLSTHTKTVYVEDVTYRAYFSGEAGLEAKIAENISLFAVGDLIFDIREFTVSIGFNLY